MIIGAIGSLPYDVMLVLHLLFVVAAFAPAFVWPVLNRQARTSGQSSLVGSLLDPMMHGGSLVLAGLFGILTVVLSDDVFKFSQSWISLAFVLWFLMLGVFFAGLIPAQGAVKDNKPDADKRLAMFYGGMHLLLLVQIIVMVWKPGL